MTFTYPTVTTIDTFYTDGDGMLITPEKLEYGMGYSLVEVTAPYGYVLNSDPVYFDITEDNSTEENAVTVVVVTKENAPQMGVINVEKTGEYLASVVDTEDSKRLVYEIGGMAGAEYTVTAAEDIVTPDGTLRYSKDYQSELDSIKANNAYDELEMSGSRAVWPEVLSIYAVKTTSDPDNPQEVATMNDEKKQLLKDIFWEMNEISYETEEVTETVIIETDDGEGNIIEEEVEETTVYLYITVSHKSVDEMMAQYGFTEEQKSQVAELLAQDGSMWAAVLYGVYGADDQIVMVALSQIGNVGGEPYWSWYGFGSRVEWCACFVSWCADQCGYIETGVIPKYAGCVNGVQWFRDRGQWAENDIEPAPGMIIFFDWDNKGSSGPQDGESDHTGIVERVENGVVYTVEGNSGDACRENH